MLYRLDLATKFDSLPSLLQHMMDETVLDGILELRTITRTPMAGSTYEHPQLGLPGTFLSFRREGKDVIAVALYGPRTPPTPPTSSPYNLPATNYPSTRLSGPVLEVKKYYTNRVPFVWVFEPLVQHLLKEGVTTVLFECRSYLADSNVARECRAADAARSAAAAAQREANYRGPPPPPTSNQNSMYDPNGYQWRQQQELYAYEMQQDSYNPPVVAASAWNPNATYKLTDPVYFDAYGNPINHPPQQQYQPPSQPPSQEPIHAPSTSAHSRQRSQRTSGGNPTSFTSQQQYQPSSQSPGYGSHASSTSHLPQRAQRISSGSSSRVQKSTASPPRPDQEESAMELLTRRAPFKRMVGYAGKQHDSSVAVYELSDEIAATTFNDSVLSMGMANIAVIGGAMGRASPASHGGSSHGGSSSRRI